MSSSMLVPGTLFAGRYRVEKCIAEGGMGAVYEVLHAETGRRHALKIMHAHTLASADLRDRFRREARVAANIQSEFIVDVFDAGVDTTTDLPFLVMELLQGEELGRLLAARGRFSAGETVLFLGQVAMALDKTHRAMIVHRDLKPENLFLTQRDDGSPRVKVLDFGVAKIVAETSTNAAATKSLGTPLYMAPEQFQPGNRVSPATDLFALGMIAYAFLVGQTYWSEEANEAANVFSFALTAIRGPQESACARARRAGVALPPTFDVWFARAVNADPQARFTQAGAMVKALAEALGVPSPLRSAGDPLAGTGSSAEAPMHARQPPFTTSGVPTVVGTTGALPAEARPRSSGPRPALIAGVIGALLIGSLLAALLLIPKSGAGPAEAAGPGATPTEAPSAVITTASIPTVAPTLTATETPTFAPAETPSASASVTTSPPTKPTGATPKPKGPKPPGTSVYIRD